MYILLRPTSNTLKCEYHIFALIWDLVHKIIGRLFEEASFWTNMHPVNKHVLFCHGLVPYPQLSSGRCPSKPEVWKLMRSRRAEGDPKQYRSPTWPVSSWQILTVYKDPQPDLMIDNRCLERLECIRCHLSRDGHI